MIHFTCHCGKEVQAPDNAVGKMGQCPSCGAKIQVPRSQEPEGTGIGPATPPPLSLTPPPFPSMSPNDGTKACPYCGEEIKQVAIICRFCRMDLASDETARAQGHDVHSAGVAVAVPVQMVERTLWQDNPTHWSYLGFYVLAAILIPVVVGIPLLIWAILDRKHTVYTVTNIHVTRKRGIIGKDLSEVDVKDIRNVLVMYGVSDRILGFGTVGVATAAQAGIEIKMTGCRAPESVRQLIVDAKDRTRE